MASNKLFDSLVVGEYAIPIFLHKELRNSIRFSVTKKGLVVRCPYLTSSSKITSQAKTWCKKAIHNKPSAFTEFKWKDYSKEKIFTINGDRYNLAIVKNSTEKDKITWDNSSIMVEISDDYRPIQESKVIRLLLSKFVAKKYLFTITQRVHAINDKYFNVTIGKVSLKNNRSNWGSCSNKGNINLSIKLLKAPQDVIDYVILHELAHRIEMNHSPKFWNIVEKACPDYKTKEKWLKENSHLCTL